MIFEQISVGGDRNFAYLVADEKSRKAMIVDPAYDMEKILSLIDKYRLRVQYVVNTHGHYDHTQLSAEITSSTGAKLVGHESIAGLAKTGVRDGDVLSLGSLDVRVFHTPGHTADSICLLAEDKLITGDTLFVGKVGGTSQESEARQEYDSLFNKLLRLPDNVEVWPGHDYGVQPNSTIGHERQTNPFLLRTSFEDFLDLKINWAQYKKEHGIA